MAGFCRLDQARAGIDSGEFTDFCLEQWPDEHALAATNVDDRLARLGIEHLQGGGQDDVTMVV